MPGNKPPSTVKRPIPKYVLDRCNQFGQAVQAILQQQQQFLADFGGITGVDLTRFRIWWDFDDKPQPTYEVLTIADHERRARLQAAVQAAGGGTANQPAPQPAKKADARPRKGERPMALPPASTG